jgi:holin-like protein
MRARINAPGVAGPILRLIIGVSILLVFGLAGNRLIALYSIPLPGAVVGLVLLAGALAIARRVSAPGTAWLPENVAPASRALLNHLGLLFVPAGCAVLTEGDVLPRNWIPILAALVVSTTLGLAVCGWIMHRFVSGRAE